MLIRLPCLRLSLLVALLSAAVPALAEPFHVGLVIPQSGQFKPLGDHVREAFSVWDNANPGVFDDIVEGEDGCSEQAGADAAAAMIEAGANVVVGFLCTESLAAALPLLSDENIPVITLTVRADIIGEEAARLGWKFFRLAPRAGSEADIASEAILRLWADKPFALIEDGAISGRELVEAIRIKLEERGLKPTFVDNYRPGQATQPSLIRRLKSAGVARVFVGGERSDLAVIAMEAERQGVALKFMGGDLLHAPQGELPLPDGTLAVLAAGATPGPEAEAASRILKDNGLIAEGLRIPAYAAAEILGTIATRMEYSETSLDEALRSTTFSTALGPVTFDENGERREPGFVLAILRDGEFKRLSIEGAARIGGDGQ
ncbi:amino acid/amide ABC transporter substrate-binding protein (HAAT family) [Hoeflea halophila]|uniref:Amino acid/amide ABC transporter substrate-binding protein (HAAT family) n=1 Tax=Hoeflea halophila TaxID=714899 RepID=A0A286HL38_9HYPH|nr:ABC transporter substrate-binding protein [Hoeflea halophila]SOE08525.1 amino acid/amide ABC transporter substrate-binding protein (HAAT family) [Hoeflea halophila]